MDTNQILTLAPVSHKLWFLVYVTHNLKLNALKIILGASTQIIVRNILLYISHSTETHWYTMQWDLYLLGIKPWLMFPLRVYELKHRPLFTWRRLCLCVWMYREKCLPFRYSCEENFICQHHVADITKKNKARIDVGGLHNELQTQPVVTSHSSTELSRGALSRLWLTGDGV